MTPPTPTRLRLEHGPRLLGVGAPAPRLSWWLADGSGEQLAYEVSAVVDGAAVSSGELESPESVLRPWPFDALTSRSVVSWQVRVRTASGWSGWSDSQDFEVALLRIDDWAASFIGAVEDADQLPPRGVRGAHYLRRGFTVTTPLEKARCYATAHGIYELFLDGQRLGDMELTPGFTAYRTNLEFQTYDLTAQLTPGGHELVVVLSDGWWRGAHGFTHQDRAFGEQLAFLGQLETFDTRGDRATLGTDAGWEVATSGPIVAADLMEGERVDLRIDCPPATGWQPVTIVGSPDERLTVSPSPPTRRVREYPAARIDGLDGDRHVVDLGFNINGWVRLSAQALGPAGNRVRLRHGELLGADGDVDVEHLRSTDIPTDTPISVGQIDEVVSDGRRPFEPRHTTHGFQYVGIDGAAPLTAADVTGVMVHTDLTRTGWFECSDDRVNRLHEATVLSFLGNACEVPTDCPQRERAGWTGDYQIFVKTAAYLFDVAGFTARWLRDLRADQWEDGRVPNFVPDPFNVPGKEKGLAAAMTGSAGWGDAAIYVPHQMWRSYGDVDLLAEQYDSMRSWIGFALARAEQLRHPAFTRLRPEPAPHDRYLWDVGFHWGEWCEPGGNPMEVLTGERDVAEIATAYLYRSLVILSEIAQLLGHADDAVCYRCTAANVRDAWRTEFVAPDGSVRRETQANLVRALAFGLLERGEQDRAVSDLVASIRAAGTTVGTGFLATPFLLPVLADHGRLDVAYELLLQGNAPGWLNMIDQGATTIWENWEKLDANGQGSLNHYSKGAVVSFLHEYVAGIRLADGPDAAGYRRFEVRPRPGGGLTSASARFDSPYGLIRASWTLADGPFQLFVDVPPGTTAEVVLPDGSGATARPGTHHFVA